MSKNKKFNKEESGNYDAGKETVKTDLPADRFPETKTVLGPDNFGVTKRSIPENVTNNEVKAAMNLKSKIRIRPDVSVDDLGDKQVGGVPLTVATELRNAAGARTLSPADDMSRTPYTPGNYRPETRYGKKRSEDLFEIDNAAIEQVVPVVEDCPDLRESPASTVGYNGRQQFKQTRQKKNFQYINGNGNNVGKLPQQLLNDASIDDYTENKVIYTSGQVVYPINSDGSIGNIDPQADYPTTDGYNPLTGTDIMHKSNYMPTALEFTIANGHITDVHVEEYRYIVPASATVRDEANMNWQVDANNVAKTMVKIQKEMGRETTDKWTALAYVIDQTYEYNMLMHDIEASCGSIMAIADRAAVSSLAYQRNIIKKDGINPQRNAIKMILEGYTGVMANNDSTNITDLDFNRMIFNRRAYRAGSVAAIIAMFDSTRKYRTKGDILGMQRSLGMHLSQINNNIAPFRCKEQFIKVLDKAHMFSTIDGNYNPYLPIFQTKRINIINPISLNKFLVNWRNPNTLTIEERRDPRRNLETGSYAPYNYTYSDLRNEYTQPVRHPIIEGLLEWLIKHEGAIVSTYGDGTVTIPFTFDMQAPNMLSFMLCSASQYIARQRNIIFRDVLFAGEQETYIWDDLKTLKELDPLHSTQLKIGRYDEPLTMGKLANDTAIRVLYGEHKQLTDHDDGVVQYYEPWPFNEAAFERQAGGSYALGRGFFSINTPYNYSYPSIKDGVRHEHVDVIKSMDAKDVMLSLDRKLDLLKYCSVVDVYAMDGTTRLYTAVTPYCDATTNGDKIKLSVLRYDGNSDGRLVTKYLLDEGNNYDLPALGMYCIPKEIGFIDDSYLGLDIVTSASAYGTGEDPVLNITVLHTTFDSTDTSGVNSIYYNGGKAAWVTSYRVEADSPSNHSIDRSAALTNTFYRFFATTDAYINNVNDQFICETGLVLTRSYNDGVAIDVPAIYNLGSDNESTHAFDNVISTLTQYEWTLLQRFFMPVNPFANAYQVNNRAHAYDPFEGSFVFGVCGFLAADYTQHVLERLSTYDQLGFDYTEDVNIKESLIFR